MRWLLVLVACLPALTLQAAPDGALLYAQHCATCHGENGQGGVGVPLALPSFLNSVDDGFLKQTIRYGRPGRVMPAFGALSDAQLVALVGFIRGWSGQPAPVFPESPIKGDAGHGRTLYAEHCAICHGDDGGGGRGTGVTFSRPREQPIVAPALNNSGFLQAASDAMIRQTLRKGREGTPMLSFLEQGLSEQDIEDLVSYVRSFEGLDTGVEHGHASESATLTMESPYSLDETVENLKQAITSQNFILIRTDTLEHGLVKEGDENPRQVILHFCNFNFLFEALAVDPRVGMFLPCTVTATEDDAGKVFVSTINPQYLSHLFNNSELDEYCDRMRGVYEAILEEATL